MNVETFSFAAKNSIFPPAACSLRRLFSSSVFFPREIPLCHSDNFFSREFRETFFSFFFHFFSFFFHFFSFFFLC
jgi:hypothetical protein